MAEEQAAPEQQPDDIRSAVEAAFAQHEAPELPLTEKTKSNGAAAGETSEAGGELAKTERARGPDGKFVKAEEAATVDESKAESETTEEKLIAETKSDKSEEQKTEEKTSEEKSTVIEPPATLSASDKETFRALPQDAQRVLADFVKRQDQAFTKKTQALAALKTEYEPVEKMFEPHREIMRAKGFTPRTLIEAWANVETRLAKGGNDAVSVIKGLVDGYRIDPGQVLSALGIRAPEPQALQLDANGNPIPPVEGRRETELPPQLLAELRELRVRQDRIDEERAMQARLAAQSAEDKVTNEIEQFKSVMDGKGNLLHPYFEDVEETMTTIALGYTARKQAPPPLAELYETAVMANPSTRAKVIAAERQADDKRKSDEARAKAAAAKKAASSVTGAPGSGQTRARPVERSLREELEAAAEESIA